MTTTRRTTTTKMKMRTSLSCLWKRNFLHRFTSAAAFLGSGPGGNRRGQNPVEYRGNLYVLSVHTSICPSVRISVRTMGGWMDGWTDGTHRFPLYSIGLCPLRFPQRPLPCLHNSYHLEIPEQDKGTDDHLLPLGDWFFHIALCISRQKYAREIERLNEWM